MLSHGTESSLGDSTRDSRTQGVSVNAQSAVLVVGPLFLDVVLGPLKTMPVPGEETWVSHCAFAAGGVANQAVALARLGVKIQLRSYIGSDEPGSVVRALLRSEGVSEESLVAVPRQSVTASLSVAGDRAMVTYGTDNAPFLEAGDCPAALVADLRAVRSNRETVKEWRDGSKPPLVISDVGWDESGKWDSADLDDLCLVDYFVPNEAEALNYTGCADIRAAAQRLKERVPFIVITRGSKGVFAMSDNEEISLPPVPVTALDPTGAGDIFGAALTWGALQGLSLREIVSVASLAAAWSVQSVGGSTSAPTVKDLTMWARSVTLPSGYVVPMTLVNTEE